MLLAAKSFGLRVKPIELNYIASPILPAVAPSGSATRKTLEEAWNLDWSRLWNWYSAERNASDRPPLTHDQVWRDIIGVECLHGWREVLLLRERATGGLNGLLESALIGLKVRRIIVLPLEPFRSERLTMGTVVVSAADRWDVDRYREAVEGAGSRTLLA